MRIFDKSEIKSAAKILREGGIIAFPTETVYGLGASLFQEEAIRRIYRVKGRPQDNPLIVHLSDLSEIHRVAIDIPEAFYLLAGRFWPGPLTFVLKRHPLVPASVSAGLDTIAVRLPAHPLARLLIAEVGAPLAAPSANLSGRPSATEIGHVVEDFEGLIEGAIDGSFAEIGVESTVITLLETPPILLRPGSISKQELEDVLGYSIRLKTAQDRVVSPGMKYRHYAPKVPVFLVYTRQDLERMSLEKALVLCREDVFLPSHVKRSVLSTKTLYALFRKAEQEYESIVVFCDSITQGNAALMNRLLHAALKPSST